MDVKTVAKWAVLVPLFAIPFLALYVANDLYFPFITGKNFAFRVLVEIMLAGWVVLALADKRYRPQFSWILASFALLVVWMAFADALAVNPHKAFWSNYERMDGFVTLIHIFALFLIAGPVLSATKLWRNWWLTFVSVAGLVCAYGLFQLMGLAEIHQSSTRLDASLGNSEYLAGFLTLAIAITLWQAFAEKTKGLRNTLFALAALEVVILFGTGTRGTFVAFVAAAVLGGLLWLFELGKKGRRGALIFIAALVVFLGGFFALKDTAFIANDPNLSRFASISLSDLETRFKIWDMALTGIGDRPLTGWGHEGYNYVFNTYFDPTLYGQEQWFDRAHNVYLDWAIAGGIPALLLFLALGITAAVRVYRSRELQPYERVLILTGLAAYAIQGLAVFDNLFTYVPIIMLLAYVHALRTRPIPAFEKPRELKGAALDTVALPVVGVLALVVIYMVNVPSYAAAQDLIEGLTPRGTVESRLGQFEDALARDPFATQEIREQLLSFAQSIVQSEAPADLKTRAVSFASEEMEKEIARAPGDARLYVLYASFLRTADDFDMSRQMSAKARELSPTKQGIILEQGINEWQAGNAEEALRFFHEAYDLAPEAEELAVYAAVGHIITNDIPGAKTILNERFGTTTVNHMLLAFAYQQVRSWNDLIAVMQKRYAEENTATSGYQLATSYAQAGRLNEARAQVRAVMADHPESASQGTALLMQLGVR